MVTDIKRYKDNLRDELNGAALYAALAAAELDPLRQDLFFANVASKSAPRTIVAVRILHPWPQDRFAVNHPRWKPGA